MGSDNSTGRLEPDGLPSDGVPFLPASPEQMQTYRDGRAALDRFKATVPPLVHADSPHEKLFVAAFDGTGNDGDKDPAHKTNVYRLYEQFSERSAAGGAQFYADYLPGAGTQADVLLRTLDGGSGFSSPARVEEMYKKTVDQANRWLRADPEVQLRVLSTGFSRGGSQAAGFTNLLHERGIPDVTSRVVGADNSYTYTRYIVEPGRLRQAVVLFDPVATGFPMELDRRLPPSVESGLQITALDERRSLFRSDRVIAPGLSEDGRFLGLEVAGAHSDIGGSYARDGLGLRSCNLAVDYCNALGDRPFLSPVPEPDEPHLDVVHRSEQGNLLYKLSPKVDRLQPDGINLRQAPVPVASELASTGLKAAGGVAIAASVYDVATGTARAVDLLHQDNPTGAASEILHVGGHNLGAFGGGMLGAEIGAEIFGTAGAETGPFDGVIALVGGLGGGVVGAIGGDAIADAVDRHRVYDQTDPQGRTWHYDPDRPQQGWTRLVPTDQLDTDAMRFADGLPIYQMRSETAPPALSERLTYQANSRAAELALGQPATPRDPYTQPAGPGDAPSLREAPWTRDAQTGQWSRVVAQQAAGSRFTANHEETARPSRAAELDAAAGQTIADNLADTRRGIAEQYQAMYERHGWQSLGPMPDAVIHALKEPKEPLDKLLASDGHDYSRGDDGQWTTPGRLWGTRMAEGNIRAELDATLAREQAASSPPAAGPPPAAPTGEQAGAPERRAVQSPAAAVPSGEPAGDAKAAAASEEAAHGPRAGNGPGALHTFNAALDGMLAAAERGDWQSFHTHGRDLPGYELPGHEPWPDARGTQALPADQRPAGPLPDIPHPLLDDPAHADHALFEQAYAGVVQLDAGLGRKPDEHSRRLAGALARQVSDEGLQRIDRVMLSDDGRRAFAIQGNPGDWDMRFASVCTDTALNTPLAESSRPPFKVPGIEPAPCEAVGLGHAAAAQGNPASLQPVR